MYDDVWITHQQIRHAGRVSRSPPPHSLCSYNPPISITRTIVSVCVLNFSVTCFHNLDEYIRVHTGQNRTTQSGQLSAGQLRVGTTVLRGKIFFKN